MEQALPHNRIVGVEAVPSIEDEPESPFGVFAGLAIAVPVGLGLWALLVLAAMRLF